MYSKVYVQVKLVLHLSFVQPAGRASMCPMLYTVPVTQYRYSIFCGDTLPDSSSNFAVLNAPWEKHEGLKHILEQSPRLS